MKTAKQTRVRGVVLVSEAREMLDNALLEWWAAKGREGRPTREQVAEKLGVSVQTVHRIWVGVGVDKASLKLAFNRLQLHWTDGYSTPCSARVPAIPCPITELIGREAALTDVAAAVAHNRLVTLTGLGGVGKTRLALKVAELVADDYADGVLFLDLAGLRTREEILQLAADSLRIQTAGASLDRAVMDWLCTRRLLVFMDNCERVAEVCGAIVTEWLYRCPNLRSVATSRLALRVAEEFVFPVSPLACPEDDRHYSVEDLLSIPAVSLFVTRAAAAGGSLDLHRQTLEHIAQVCRRLDGLPLAIELAAAWTTALAAAEIEERLRQHGARALLQHTKRRWLPRCTSLDATLQLSYELLPADLKPLFLQLAVFAGGWSVEAAAAIWGHDDKLRTASALASLREYSLITAQDCGGTMRFWMLETVREFAAEQLPNAMNQRARQRHAGWVLTFAEEAARHVYAPDQSEWYDRLEGEYRNICSALDWLRSVSADCLPRLQQCIRLAMLVGHPRHARSHVQEIARFARDLLAKVPVHERNSDWYIETRLQVVLLDAYACDDHLLQATMEHAIESYEQVGDSNGIACLRGVLGWVYHERCDYTAALECFTDAATRSADGINPVLHGKMLNALALVNLRLGRLKRARCCAKSAVEAQRSITNESGILQALSSYGMVTRALGDFTTAESAYDEAFTIARKIRMMTTSAYHLEGRAYLAIEQGEHALAALLIGCATNVRSRYGWPKPESEVQEYNLYLKRLRSALPDEQFRQAWETGRIGAWGDVVAVALKERPLSELL